LPTIRDLAVKLEVNPNTVVKAYSQLGFMGVLDTQQGLVLLYAPRRPSLCLMLKSRGWSKSFAGFHRQGTTTEHNH